MNELKETLAVFIEALLKCSVCTLRMAYATFIVWTVMELTGSVILALFSGVVYVLYVFQMFAKDVVEAYLRTLRRNS